MVSYQECSLELGGPGQKWTVTLRVTCSRVIVKYMRFKWNFPGKSVGRKAGKWGQHIKLIHSVETGWGQGYTKEVSAYEKWEKLDNLESQWAVSSKGRTPSVPSYKVNDNDSDPALGTTPNWGRWNECLWQNDCRLWLRVYNVVKSRAFWESKLRSENPDGVPVESVVRQWRRKRACRERVYQNLHSEQRADEDPSQIRHGPEFYHKSRNIAVSSGKDSKQ